MAARYVVDTNVLVYALDRREPEKRERARRCSGASVAPEPRRSRRRSSPNSGAHA
jgi:hypothetical protein